MLGFFFKNVHKLGSQVPDFETTPNKKSFTVKWIICLSFCILWEPGSQVTREFAPLTRADIAQVPAVVY